MKKHLLLIFSVFLLQSLKAGTFGGQQQPIDTSAIDEKKLDEAISEIEHSKAPLSIEKVQYLSQVTRYGFKHLFSNFPLILLSPTTNR